MKDKSLADDPKSQKESDRHRLIDVFISVIAAMFGVQNHDRHRRDFEKGDPAQFIVVGILFVLAFILVLMWIVEQILKN